LTGWIHRAQLKNAKVTMLDGVKYKRVDDKGLHIERKGVAQVTVCQIINFTMIFFFDIFVVFVSKDH
jgi:hypothetical protein